MEKLNSWIFAILGVVFVLPLLGLFFLESVQEWIFALGLLVIGIGGLVKK